ncbi:MAG TPA: CheR family methyltransferase [Planctomycetaceae bacterium]|nr:CheR family methyltransferase [Planctomycetaceae bacterium]
MRGLLQANQFRHIVFPREDGRRKLVNLAPQHSAAPVFEALKYNLPGDEGSFLEWLFREAGLDIRQYRSETLHRRMSACLRTLRATSPDQARRMLDQNPRLLTAALSAMLVGVTSFFRDATVFEQFRDDILPSLVESRSGVYAWSIGCSDGAELYSLAMILAEKEFLSGSYLLGTDCRPDAIADARAGCYEPGALGQVPGHLRERHFEREGNRWLVASPIRKHLRWKVGNVLGDVEMGLWDVIMFRNTAMYLCPEAAASVWPRLEAALRPGGILILGRAERPTGAQRLRFLGPCIYRRQQR